jgi:hypothetical protein
MRRQSKDSPEYTTGAEATMERKAPGRSGAAERVAEPRRLGAGRGSLLLVVGLVASGCADPLATVSSVEQQGLALTVQAPSDRFTPNRVKYRDSGMKAAVGRAGSATLAGYIVMDGTGLAELHLSAGSVAGGAPRLGHVQIKLFNANGALLFTRNHAPGPGTPTAKYVLGALGRDVRVQLQANVVGAGRARTGVITIDVPVWRGPDLEVSALAAPQRVALLSKVGIAATVREINGDAGARAHCALFVDDEEVDRVWGMWVDAGSSVTCAFQHRFTRAGLTGLEVRLLGVEPVDHNVGNNSAQATVDVVRVPSTFAYDASFSDNTYESYWRSEWEWRSPNGRAGAEGNDEIRQSGREQYGYLWGSMPGGLTFPLDELVIQQMTRDETVHFARLLDVESDWSRSDEWGTEACMYRWFDTENGNHTFHLCSSRWGDGEPYTSLYYSRWAGDVTYFSRGYNRWWNLDENYDDVWSWNYSGSNAVGRMVSYGHEYSFFIRIDDGHGTYRMQPLVWLHPFKPVDEEMPWSCWDHTTEWGSSRNCQESRWQSSGMSGWVSGWPTY